ncbi:MAG: 50S ribosomal protein L32 [Candidatus Moranbacteria bacterium]|nr:50S ribosomal protein L32 [Candidatus Moranbacteria bacterium]
MSVPKQHHTKGRRDRARARFKILKKKLVSCSHCKKMIKTHETCPYCGFYKGKEVVKTVKKTKKKTKAGKDKAEKK